MRIAILISGVLAALAFLFPGLVFLGFFLFIIPGLLLFIAPTVFVYLAAIEFLRYFPLVATSKFRNTIAVVLCLVTSVAVMLPSHSRARARFEAAIEEDIDPAAPIELDGIVRLEYLGGGWPNAFDQCDGICSALLDMPKVRAVAVSPKGTQPSIAFRLVSASQHPEPGLTPPDPTGLLQVLADAEGRQVDYEEASRLKTRWSLRLTSDERLVSIPLTNEPEDWVLRRSEKGGEDEVKVYRVEVIRRDGTPVFRKSYLSYEVPARLFYVGYSSGLSFFGSSSGASLHVGKQALEWGSRGVEVCGFGKLLLAVGVRPQGSEPVSPNDALKDASWDETGADLHRLR
jgi:hypothetical protein